MHIHVHFLPHHARFPLQDDIICHQVQYTSSKPIWNINHMTHSAMCSSTADVGNSVLNTPHADWVVPFHYLSSTRCFHWWCWQWNHLIWDIPLPSQDLPSSAPRIISITLFEVPFKIHNVITLHYHCQQWHFLGIQSAYTHSTCFNSPID